MQYSTSSLGLARSINIKKVEFGEASKILKSFSSPVGIARMSDLSKTGPEISSYQLATKAYAEEFIGAFEFNQSIPWR